jgi:hypothetical protein
MWIFEVYDTILNIENGNIISIRISTLTNDRYKFEIVLLDKNEIRLGVINFFELLEEAETYIKKLAKKICYK